MTHWSALRLAAKVGLHIATITGVNQRHGLKPYRFERYQARPDLDFETKAADIIGLYLEPPQHAVVCCVDEKTAIQELDQRASTAPLIPARPPATLRPLHDTRRHHHGTLRRCPHLLEPHLLQSTLDHAEHQRPRRHAQNHVLAVDAEHRHGEA